METSQSLASTNGDVNATDLAPGYVKCVTEDCEAVLAVLPTQVRMRRRHIAIGGGKLWYVSAMGRWYCPVHDTTQAHNEVDLDAVVSRTVKPEHDPVNHPAHYNSAPAKCANCGTTIQCIDITRHLMFDPGNVIKYLWRKYFGGKDGEDDIEPIRKAIWYLTDELKRLESR